MTVLQALVLGVLQGLAEFLPISSSAHLTLAPWLMGWQDPGLAFDVALHLGTLVAVIWYFRKDIGELFAAVISVLGKRKIESASERQAMFLIVATVPAAIAGLLVADYAETVFRTPQLIAVALMLMGVVLWFVDRYAGKERALGSMNYRDAVAIGVAQACALLPGVSRSGSTMTAARALGFDRSAAARFSFLLSPIITAAAVALKVPDALREGINLPLIVGVTAAAVSSWLAIAVLMRYIVRNSFAVFAGYRLLLGAVVLWIAMSR